MFGVIQIKVAKEVSVTISQTMDLLEAGETQALVKSLHEFLDYQKHLQCFIQAENEHKEHFQQQRLAFVVKRLKEFDIPNASKIEVIKWDWNPLWYIITNDKSFLTSDRLELPCSHTFEKVNFISNNLL
jgi:hypothetical protein